MGCGNVSGLLSSRPVTEGSGQFAVAPLSNLESASLNTMTYIDLSSAKLIFENARGNHGHHEADSFKTNFFPSIKSNF